MATLREFIRDQSSLPVGNTIRDHIEHPATGGSGETIIISGPVEAVVDEIKTEVSVVSIVDATVEISEPVTAKAENIVAISIKDQNIEAGVCR